MVEDGPPYRRPEDEASAGRASEGRPPPRRPPLSPPTLLLGSRLGCCFSGSHVFVIIVYLLIRCVDMDHYFLVTTFINAIKKRTIKKAIVMF